MESNKKEISLVCIGKTGAGKTTLINTLMNHIMKKDYSEFRVIAITQLIHLQNPMTEEIVSWKYECNLSQYSHKQSDRLGSGSSSQTTTANIYEIKLDDFTLKIIDTPGLADTAGIEQDQKNIEAIVKGIREVSQIDGILFVQKSTDMRLDITLKYLISEVQGMLPKGCEDNIFVCLTAVVNKLKLDVLPALKEMGIPLKNKFTFENDALVHPNHLKRVAGISEDDDDALDELIAVPEAFWKQNRIQTKKLIEAARKIRPMQTRSVLDLHNKKKFQITLVHEEAHRCRDLEIQKSIVQDKTLRNISLRDLLLKNQDYIKTGIITVLKERTVYKDIETIEEITMDYHSTMCNMCREICHDRCGLHEIVIDGSLNFKNCTAFRSTENCQKCTHKCSYDKHKHSRKRLVKNVKKVRFIEKYPVQSRVDNIDYYMKNTYFQSEREIKELENEICHAKQEITKLEHNISSCYRIMSYLQGVIEKESMRAINEYYEEYVQMIKQNINSDTRTTESEKMMSRKTLERNLIDYRMFKKLANENINRVDADDFLSPEERRFVEDKLYAIEQEELDAVVMINTSRVKYSQHQQQLKSQIVIFITFISDALGFTNSNSKQKIKRK